MKKGEKEGAKAHFNKTKREFPETTHTHTHFAMQLAPELLATLIAGLALAAALVKGGWA